jgi:hypothetical protein
MVLFFAALALANPLLGQKVAEGRYQEMKDGVFLKDLEHYWTLSRTGDGYLLVDRFKSEEQYAERLFQAMGEAAASHMSPELQGEMQSVAVADVLTLDLTPQLQINNITLEGKQLRGNKGRVVQVLDCKKVDMETRCKGLKGSPRLKKKASLEMFFDFSFPMLFGSLVRQSKRNLAHADTVSLATVRFDSHSVPYVSEAEASIKFLGEVDLQIAEKVIRIGKYDVVMSFKNGASSEQTVWASSQGVVMAVQAGSRPGYRWALVEYKKYVDF